jgi:hypothetical protein
LKLSEGGEKFWHELHGFSQIEETNVAAFGRKPDYLLFGKMRRSAETPLRQIEFGLMGEMRGCILARSENA